MKHLESIFLQERHHHPRPLHYFLLLGRNCHILCICYSLYLLYLYLVKYEVAHMHRL